MQTFLHKLEITTVQREYTEKPTDFLSILTPLCTLTEISHLTYVLSHLPLFTELSQATDINIFKYTIKPLWEDEANLTGGKYIIKVKKHVGQRLFEKLLINFALYNSETDTKYSFLENVNGIVGSVRSKQVMISVWTKNVPEDKEKAVKEVRNLFGVDYELLVEFKDNDESLKDNSSYRNTNVFGAKKEVDK